MNMINKLFKFPIAMIDGENEERKVKKMEDMALEDETELDMIIGEAECPYYDFLSITDRWLPTADSLNMAMEGKFDACFVTFNSSGSFIVPWSKEKFKRKLNEFIQNLPKEEPSVEFTLFSPELLKKLSKSDE